MQKSLESFFRKTHHLVNNNFLMIASGSKKRTSDEAGMPTLSAETGSKMKKVKFYTCLNFSIQLDTQSKNKAIESAARKFSFAQISNLRLETATTPAKSLKSAIEETKTENDADQ